MLFGLNTRCNATEDVWKLISIDLIPYNRNTKLENDLIHLKLTCTQFELYSGLHVLVHVLE